MDGAFAKVGFVAGVVALKLHMVSKLRWDANLRYLYTGEQERRGRPRKYDGKVDLNDLNRVIFGEQIEPEVDLYTARVWHISSPTWLTAAIPTENGLVCCSVPNTVRLSPKAGKLTIVP